MSGKLRYVLDTNAVVALLNGNRDLAARLEAAAYVGISVITRKNRSVIYWQS